MKRRRFFKLSAITALFVAAPTAVLGNKKRIAAIPVIASKGHDFSNPYDLRCTKCDVPMELVENAAGYEDCFSIPMAIDDGLGKALTVVSDGNIIEIRRISNWPLPKYVGFKYTGSGNGISTPPVYARTVFGIKRAMRINSKHSI